MDDNMPREIWAFNGELKVWRDFPADKTAVEYIRSDIVAEQQAAIDELIRTLKHAENIAKLFHETPIENWKSKTDLQSCFFEDMIKYRKVLAKHGKVSE